MDIVGDVAPGAVIQHGGEQSAHLSDVVEVIIADDPTFGPRPAPTPTPRAMQQAEAYAFIVEQPAPKSLRFRYECEGRSAGSIPGVNNTPENRTFPAIKVVGHRGCMVIVVSCVTKDEPYKPHPHNLVGRDCHKGVCTVKVRTEGDADSCTVQFRNLGIQCVKRRDIAEALRVRESLKVNPFKTSYSHRNQPQSIDLNAVRLAFQVFLTDDAYNVQRVLPSLASEVVYDKKAMSELLIVRASHCSGPARGGTTVILLCEKVTREDTEIIFFHEEKDGNVWSERVPPEFVHKQVALVFKTPPCRPAAHQHLTVQYQLHRISDGAKSNVYNFEYIPEGQDIDFIIGNKRRKKLSYNLQEYDDRSSDMQPIKTEPRDRTPPHPMNTPGYGDQQWLGEAGAGPSWYSPEPDYYAHQPNVPGIQVQQHMAMPARSGGQALSPHHARPQTLSPGPQGLYQQTLSPGPQALYQQTLSPGPQALYQQTLSPRAALGGMSPAVSPSPHYVPHSPHYVPPHGAVSPNMMQPLGVMSPNMTHGVMSPNMAHAQGAASPNLMQSHGVMSPNMAQHGAVSPVMLPAMPMDPMMADVQQQQGIGQMPALPVEDMSLNSGDFANLSSMFDSLDRLSTRDLLQDPE